VNNAFISIPTFAATPRVLRYTADCQVERDPRENQSFQLISIPGKDVVVKHVDLENQGTLEVSFELNQILRITYFPKGEFKSTKNFEDFLKEIDAMPKESVRQIMGKHHYIPTPGTYQQQAKNYDNDIKLYMEDNIGKTDLYQLEEYWKFYISDEYRKK
jgi:hypothetical protein